MERVFLLVAANFSVLLMLTVLAQFFGIDRYLAMRGIPWGSLMIFASLMGFGSAFLALWTSKAVAKWSTGAQVISGAEGPTEQWLVATVARLAQAGGIAMPEVAFYESAEPNAFCTGPNRDSSLVAVSTGLLSHMPPHEVEAVLAHEIAHAVNGDMVSLTMISGCANAVTLVLARVFGTMVDALTQRDGRAGPGMTYGIAVFAGNIVFGLLANIVVMYFSRQREFRADAGAAQLLGTPVPMMQALARLGGVQDTELPQALAASGIAGGARWLEIFASHPPIEDRISALRQYLA